MARREKVDRLGYSGVERRSAVGSVSLVWTVTVSDCVLYDRVVCARLAILIDHTAVAMQLLQPVHETWRQHESA